jgi:hypothetical protein
LVLIPLVIPAHPQAGEAGRWALVIGKNKGRDRKRLGKPKYFANKNSFRVFQTNLLDIAPVGDYAIGYCA